MSSPGCLIVIEGPDGVGKTCLTKKLVKLLQGSGLPCRFHSFPGEAPGTLGELVYRLHHEPAELGVAAIAPAAKQAMHIAAHLDAISQVFIPQLMNGESVVLDRYWWSTRVYGAVAGVPTEVLDPLIQAERAAWGKHLPLLVFFVDRQNPWRKKEESAEWHRVARAYRELAQREGTRGPVVTIENCRPPDVEASAMASRIVAHLRDARTRAARRNAQQMQLSLADGTNAASAVGPTLVLSQVKGVRPTEVFDAYWRFATERQNVYFRRLEGGPPPWSDDPILQHHRFTNAYRASDRVSQYLIQHVIYEGDQTPEEIFFRSLLFKLFNRIETWELLARSLGTISAREFEPEHYDRILRRAMQAGQRIYSAAYIMPAVPGGAGRAKHSGHLRLLARMLRDELPRRLAEARSLRQAFELIRAYPTMGDFLAYQYAIDLNYSTLLNFSEMEFVMPGPGARSGIRKCFTSLGGLSEADIIRLVTESQEAEFARLGLRFRDLWGRPLQLIDCQNLFCEVDKYARVAYPEFSGEGGRTRIKQVLRPGGVPPAPWYPPKWDLNERIQGMEAHRDAPDRG